MEEDFVKTHLVVMPQHVVATMLQPGRQPNFALPPILKVILGQSRTNRLVDVILRQMIASGL